jgi:hypothetical protein
MDSQFSRILVDKGKECTVGVQYSSAFQCKDDKELLPVADFY